MKKIRRLLLVIPVIAGLIISSCYQDYELDANNYDIVGTFYKPDYNFNNVTKYKLVDQVIKIGGVTVTGQYDAQILAVTKNNLDALGWTQTNDSAGAGVVVVFAGITTGTTTVTEDEDYCWYDYWGYTYCDDYDVTYTYSTGTVGLFLGDLSLRNGTKVPVQWTAVINGLTETGNVTQRITTTINQAFSQSPYLK